MNLPHLSALAACLLASSLITGCGRDGLTFGDRPGLDATQPADAGFDADGNVPDTGLPDGFIPGDASVPDAVFPDSSLPDTSLPDSSVPDAVVPDTGPFDTGVPDTGPGPDASIPDAVVPDTGPFDTGVPDTGPGPDAGPVDTGTPDGGLPDLGVPDGGAPDTGPGDATVPDLGTPDSGVPCPMGCAFLDTDCAVGVCAPNGQTCIRAPRPTGPSCDDGDLCTTGDSCRFGRCRAGAAVDCSALDDACNAGICDATTGACSTTPVPDGVPCDDGDACTLGACAGGACVGTPNPPPGDVCTDAIPVQLQPGLSIETGNNECATDQGTGSCTLASGGRDIIYQLQPNNATRRLRATTVTPASGTSYDTVLHIQSMCVMPTELVCDDDSGAIFLSQFDTVVPRTQDSFLFVDAFGISGGDYQLELEVDPQDTCASPSVLPFPGLGQTVTVAGNTTGANNTFTANCAGASGSADHVYELVVPTQASLRLETLDPGTGRYDTALSVRSSTCAAGGAGVIACDDDGAQNFTLSLIEQTFAPGTYYVVVDGFGNNSAGEYQLAVTQTPPLEVFTFPEVGDARQPLSGPFTGAGQFVEGIRNSTVSNVGQVQISLQVTNNLTCAGAAFLVRINNVNVGNFFVRPGDTSVSATLSNITGVSGGRYNIRYELARDVPMMCGNVVLPDGVSTIALGN